LTRIQLKILALSSGIALLVVAAVALGRSAASALGESTTEAHGLYVAAAVGLVAAFLATMRLARMVLDPLDQVKDLLSELSKGNFDRRLDWRLGDERDAIAVSINKLADRLAGEIDEAHQEAHRLEAVMSSMAEGVLVLDLSGRILLANPRFRELFAAWGPIHDRSVLEVVRNREIDEILSLARESPEPVIRDIEIHNSKDRILLTHAVGFPLEGPRAGTVTVFHDVSEIQRVDRIRRDFIANASHELRTPLTSIQGFAETLGASSLDAEQTDACLAAILRNARRMGSLIDDLMDLSRIESGEVAIDRERVDVCQMVRTLLEDLRPRLSRARLVATLETPEAPDAWADRRALEQILGNLVSNAIRYNDEGGSIAVHVDAKTDLLEITVADTGIGIPEEARERIFERFYRVDAARSRAVGSTGLGLSITKHLVQAMGGTIRVESEVDRGSRFIFSIPRHPQSEPDPDRSLAPG